jgi:hypothetical protein
VVSIKLKIDFVFDPPLTPLDKGSADRRGELTIFNAHLLIKILKAIPSTSRENTEFMRLLIEVDRISRQGLGN